MKIIVNARGEEICCAAPLPPSVTKVQPQEDYTLLLTFANGEVRQYDAKPLLKKPVFAALKNPGFFKKARSDGYTVVWNDEIDLDPVHVYECSKPLAPSAASGV